MQKSIKGLLCGTILIAALGLTGCGNNAQSDLEEVVGMNKEQSTSAIEVLKNAGISDVESVQKVPNATNLYELRSEKYGAFFMKVNGNKDVTSYIYETLPFYSNGNNVRDIDDLYLSNDERIEFQVLAEEDVKKRLKAPATASFEEHPLIVREKDKVTARGKVDAENSFGAKIRTPFVVEYTYPDKNFVRITI